MRVIKLFGCISEDNTFADEIYQIFEWNREDDLEEAAVKNHVRKPIHVMIQSDGGLVYEALGLYDAMKMSRTPVYTYVFGQAMSMGLILFLGGQRRMMTKNSVIMYHGITGGAPRGMTELVKARSEELQRLDKLCDKIIADETKLKKKCLAANKINEKTWFITAEEAVDYGIADEIILAFPCPD